MTRTVTTDDATIGFYDDLAPTYDLIYADWDQAIERSAAQLHAFIGETWGGRVSRILDAACGIGTQALGLAALGYDVTASDISPAAVERARQEAAARDVRIDWGTADLRALSATHGEHDLVLAWDNALPHLLTDDDILLALREVYRCTAPGGGCLFSVRDYDREPRATPAMIPFGIRQTERGRTAVFQVRDWDGDYYDMSMYFVEDLDGACTARVARGGRYYAISTDRLLALMRDAGFTDVRRVDEPFFQPALAGTRPERAP